MHCEWQDKIFSVTSQDFQSLALEIFQYQFQHNAVYRAFVTAVKVNPSGVNSLEKIPFLPIGFFKTHRVTTGDFTPSLVFESSGTTGMNRSRHFVNDAGLYQTSFIRAFEKYYGSVNEWCIIGLLPSYLERKTSSLVFMVNELIRQSGHPQSGFYLNNLEKLYNVLSELESKKQKTLLLGVTFALLDFAERFPLALSHTVVMETGGMKGRKKELTRKEVHSILKEAFCKKEIHAEYGMTELLSQAYSQGHGIFQCPSWMKVLIREEEDPFQVIANPGESGVLNIIDLANVYSCSFIATDDLGKLQEGECFEVLGRRDESDLRGCSLLL